MARILDKPFQQASGADGFMIKSIFHIMLATVVVVTPWCADRDACLASRLEVCCGCCVSPCQQGIRCGSHVSKESCFQCVTRDVPIDGRSDEIARNVMERSLCQCDCRNEPLPPVENAARYQSSRLRTSFSLLTLRIAPDPKLVKRQLALCSVRPHRFYDGYATNQLFCHWLI